MTLRQSLLFVPLALAAACSPHISTCTVGQSASCTCTDGRNGAQVCQGDGTFGACSCTGTDPNPGGDDGGTVLDGPDMRSSSGPKRVFVTKLAYNGTAVTDQICQNAADAVTLGGTWRVWRSSQFGGADRNAIDHITGTGPWKLITGEVAFQNHAQLSTTPSVPIQVTEMGIKLGMSELVFTGTNTGGVNSTYDCGDWGGTAGYTVTLGLCSSSDAGWTAYTSQPCTLTAHLYCFEL